MTNALKRPPSGVTQCPQFTPGDSLWHRKRITLTSLFGRELAAIESIRFFGSRDNPLKTMRTF
jgi:hypothetical protein